MSANLTALETRHLDPARTAGGAVHPLQRARDDQAASDRPRIGQLALILKGLPGAHIGKHKHYGSVTLYTIRVPGATSSTTGSPARATSYSRRRAPRTPSSPRGTRWSRSS